MNSRVPLEAMMLACLLAMTANAQTNAPEHLLRLAFEEGGTQHWRKTVVMEVKVDGKSTLTANLELTLASTVTGLRAGGAFVQQTVRRAAYRVISNDARRVELTYDSDTDGAAGMPGIGQLVDKPVSMA